MRRIFETQQVLMAQRIENRAQRQKEKNQTEGMETLDG
jgi:hypothetical protein